MAELDAETVKQIDILIGEVKGLHERFHERFDALDGKIDTARTTLDERLTRHEKREEPRLAKLERLMWIAICSVVALSASIPLGLNAVSVVAK